jgi:general stress protein CsbA
MSNCRDELGMLISSVVEDKLAEEKVSFKLGVNGIQEIFTIALMVVLVFAVLYSEMELTFKVGIGALVFSIIFLTSIAGQMLRQLKKEEKKHL